MGQFPDLTLAEKAAVDSGFDRLPERIGGLVRFRSTHPPVSVVVGLQAHSHPILAWLPRSAFSVDLLDVVGAEIATAPTPEPLHGEEPLIALGLADLSALRKVFRCIHRSAAGAAGDSPDPATAPPTDPVQALVGATRTPVPSSTRSHRKPHGRPAGKSSQGGWLSSTNVGSLAPPGAPSGLGAAHPPSCDRRSAPGAEIDGMFLAGSSSGASKRRSGRP